MNESIFFIYPDIIKLLAKKNLDHLFLYYALKEPEQVSPTC